MSYEESIEWFLLDSFGNENVILRVVSFIIF